MVHREDADDAIADIRRREMKETVKLAIKEWLDEQALKFGRWSFRFLFALMLGAMLYGALLQSGWAPPTAIGVGR
jgi:hypothetical protein